MKRANILITLLCAALAFGAPLFAQDALESDMERIAEDARKQAEASAQSPEASAAPAEPAAPESTAEQPEQKAKGMPMSEPPKRFFEIGVDVSGGVANNALGFSDLFRKEIVLDIPEIQKKVGENGMIAALSPLVNGFLNINIGEFLGIGVFTKVEGDINFTLGSALLDFLANGNGEKHDMSGEAVSVAGGIFVEAGLRGFLHLDRWTFTASPAAFVPLVYIPKSTLDYTLNTSTNFELRVNGKIDVYTPFSLEEVDYAQIADMSRAGFDLTIGAEYGLFDWLYVGGTANNIPIIPSTLTHRMTIKADDLGISIPDPLSNPEMETNMEVGDPEYVTDANQSVRRPLTFDVYAKWQVLDMRFLKFVLKPNIGFTAITASDKPNFNWGIQADTNLLFLSFQLGTGLNQGVWKHRAGIGINLRILEILAEASLQSTDFLGSFNASGLGIGVGVRFGF